MDGFGQPPVQDTAENSLEGSSTVVEPSIPAPTASPTVAPSIPPTISPTPAPITQPVSVQPNMVIQPVVASPSFSPSQRSAVPEPTPTTPSVPIAPGTPSAPRRQFRQHFHKLNIYLLSFVLVVILAVVVVVVAATKSHNSAAPAVSSTNLSQQQLEQLATTNVSIGNSNQVLNIGSNAIFGQQVLLQKDLDVAGNLKLGGLLSLPSLNVSGTSTLGQTQLSKLTVSGDSAFSGSVTINQNLSVAGTASFSGAISANLLTVQNLQLSGNVAFNNHVTAGGTTPTRSSGSALGSGGTTSISGSDTAGSIAINTGNSPSAGCFITITFSQAFNAAPHVVISPIGSGAAGLAYYVNRSTTSFSVCSTSPPPAGQSFGFDYIIFD